jgi:DNA-binding beta-propeller fold protein YncE
VAVNSTGVDITSVAIAPASVPPGTSICPPTATYAPPQFIDFGLGAFTARQLLVASNGSRVVVIPAGINKILTAVPGTPGATVITLPAGATEALSGALTSDGNTLWVGVAGTNTVDKIDLVAGADVLQIPTSFKKADGTAVPPNIVTMKPK